jgi:Raf kinase inhibitor-like YbhB/YbcL family protein
MVADSVIRWSAVTLSIHCSAFAQGAAIPKRYTCDGDDVSPPLSWSGAPAGAKSLVLVIEDPDAPDPAAPKTTWVHWILYNIPPSTASLAEDAARHGLPPGTLSGRNDWGRTQYGGPCPPIGRHRYFHRLFALDGLLPDLRGPNRSSITRAMHGHVLAEAELIGTYLKAPRG